MAHCQTLVTRPAKSLNSNTFRWHYSLHNDRRYCIHLSMAVLLVVCRWEQIWKDFMSLMCVTAERSLTSAASLQGNKPGMSGRAQWKTCISCSPLLSWRTRKSLSFFKNTLKSVCSKSCPLWWAENTCYELHWKMLS